MKVQIIEKIQGRIDRNTGLQINRKLKVAAYARVSTDSEDQLNSFESQVKYYNEKITKNIEWSFVEVYADESISGTQDYKRSNFMRMIQDSMNGKIDLILTKSISIFARNTLDTLKYVRMLKEKNVAILFEEENINTLEMAGELLLTILSSVAQQEYDEKDKADPKQVTFVLKNESKINYEDYLQASNDINEKNLQMSDHTC